MSFENSFVHLHLHSAYSLAEGAIKIEDLVGLCQHDNMPAVAVTDTKNLFGALEFAMASAKSGIQPIIGCQVQLGLEGHQLVFLVQSEQGYRNLCKLVSQSWLEIEETEDAHISWQDLEKNTEGLICLSGGLKGPIGQYLLFNQHKKAEEALKRLKKIFGDRLYIELQRHGISDEDVIEAPLIELAYKHAIPLVATNDCYFPDRKMHEAHDALLCIAEGRYIIENDRRKVTLEHYFKSASEMRELFADIPEAVDNTLVIARRCHFLLKAIDPILPPFETGDGRSETEELKAQSEEGLAWRLEDFVYGEASAEEKEKIAKPYRERLEFELKIITEMGYPGYFLICSDFIKWAKDQNIPVGPGRGSGAGSVVAWVLKITDIDPLQFNLLFERFLNPERVSMPDFDIDFCQDRRDEVIRYVQDRFGYDRVAQIITFGKLQARAVVRDVGRVLQMPYPQVDRIAKMIPSNPANPISLKEAMKKDADLRAEIKKDETANKLITIALQLEGLYRHASTHAAGVVIGDRPLQELVPLYRDHRSDMPVTQFNMKYVEQAGLVKFDFLGLKTMTVIQKAVDVIKENSGREIEILQVPLDDKKTYEMLAQGENTGVFQLEGAGMRDLGKQMKVSNFDQITAVVALFRPGPMENIPKYLSCLHGWEEHDYMHPKLKPVLEETYGIMVYQEQVMLAAQILAGYSLGGADLLRRAMGKKIQAEMDAQRDIFVKGAAKHSDVPEDQANKIFDQIAKFAGYGFNKAHSVGYAMIAYWTAWLKANYPVEFLAASMTLDKGNTDKLAIFKQEIDRMKIELLPPDINNSNVDFKVEDGKIRYALAAIKNVGAGAMAQLIETRKQGGAFKSMDDFVARIDPKAMNKRQFEHMVCAGVFDSLYKNRAGLVEAADLVLREAHRLGEARESGLVDLFAGEDASTRSLEEFFQAPEWEELEKLRREFSAIGFYLSAHPLDTKSAQLERLGIVPMSNVSEALAHRNSAMIEMAGVLIRKQIKVSPKKGNKYAFMQLSDASGIFEVTVFSETLTEAHDILEVGETLLLKVIAEQREDQIRYTVQKISKLDASLSDKVQEVQIFLDKEDPAKRLKELLGDEGQGKIGIRIFVPLQNGTQAEITLPGKWNFPPAVRDELLKMEGVSNVREL